MLEMRGGVCWDMSSTVAQQTGLPRPLGGYQPNVIIEPHSPAPAWHMHHQILPKQEPIDEERNDSGINSGSDAHSSPGSEHSQDYNTHSYSSHSMQNQAAAYYATPIMPRISTSATMGYHQNMHNGFHPLTPPSAEPMTSPKSNSSIKADSSEENTTLTPRSSPTTVFNENSPTPRSDIEEKREESDHLRRLQTTCNGLLPPPPALSPKMSEHSMDDDNKSDVDMDEYDEQGLRIPKVNSHGKVKTFKCKQCDFVAITKLDFWEHSKGHIKADKLLTCPKCPFVTEYKHHLEYHLRNHFGSKPFKCDKCSYSCVNKSMLNSHMKSHSNIYQYRCSDCSYATKYCHSLKLHLRKYGHKPAMVLNPDGTPNPLPIIDVYGTRRGPKQKMQLRQEEMEQSQQAMQNSLAQFMLNSSPQLQLPFPYPFLGGFPGALGNPLLFQQNLAQLAAQSDELPEPEDQQEPHSQRPATPKNQEAKVEDTGALDLSKPEVTSEPPVKNRRKGRAFKLDRLVANQSSDEDDDDTEEQNISSNHSDDTSRDSHDDTKLDEEKEEITNNNKPGNYSCQFCCIAFGDVVLYTMHMGYHGYKDPFTCNMCGEQCNDKVSFFLHIARTSHS